MKHVYFIAETSGSMREADLRETDKSKFACAHRHFALLSDSTVKYDVITSYDDLYNIIRNNEFVSYGGVLCINIVCRYKF